jgi:putative membrane protein
LSQPDPRFTLANERTALAWVRTGLAFVAAGLGAATAAHVLELDSVLAAAGVVAVVLGAALTVGGMRRWRLVQAAIEADAPLPANRMVPLAAASVVVVASLAVATTLVQWFG